MDFLQGLFMTGHVPMSNIDIVVMLSMVVFFYWALVGQYPLILHHPALGRQVLTRLTKGLCIKIK